MGRQFPQRSSSIRFHATYPSSQQAGDDDYLRLFFVSHDPCPQPSVSVQHAKGDNGKDSLIAAFLQGDGLRPISTHQAT